MPLSPVQNRKLLHTRVVTCKGFQRDDELFDIEGHLVDTKPFEFPNKDRGGSIKAGEALHEMWIRLTIDAELKVKDAEASIDNSPYNYCKSISAVFKGIIGLQIAPGWNRRIKTIMGGTKGCTHLTELLGPMATTAIQTIFAEKNSHGKESKKLTPGFINSCHSHATDSPVVKEHWPDAYKKSAIDSSG